MALRKCAECDGKVSEFAEACPHCGAPKSIAFSQNKEKSKNLNNNKQADESNIKEGVIEYSNKMVPCDNCGKPVTGKIETCVHCGKSIRLNSPSVPKRSSSESKSTQTNDVAKDNNQKLASGNSQEQKFEPKEINGMIKCQSCGKKVTGKLEICVHCGAPCGKNENENENEDIGTHQDARKGNNTLKDESDEDFVERIFSNYSKKTQQGQNGWQRAHEKRNEAFAKLDDALEKGTPGYAKREKIRQEKNEKDAIDGAQFYKMGILSFLLWFAFFLSVNLLSLNLVHGEYEFLRQYVINIYQIRSPLNGDAVIYVILAASGIQAFNRSGFFARVGTASLVLTHILVVISSYVFYFYAVVGSDFFVEQVESVRDRDAAYALIVVHASVFPALLSGALGGLITYLMDRRVHE